MIYDFVSKLEVWYEASWINATNWREKKSKWINWKIFLWELASILVTAWIITGIIVRSFWKQIKCLWKHSSWKGGCLLSNYLPLIFTLPKEKLWMQCKTVELESRSFADGLQHWNRIPDTPCILPGTAHCCWLVLQYRVWKQKGTLGTAPDAAKTASSCGTNCAKLCRKLEWNLSTVIYWGHSSSDSSSFRRCVLSSSNSQICAACQQGM